MGHIYVIAFTTGAVKVGQSVIPQQRIATHRTDARAYGTEVTDTWISPDHANYAANERRLISFCSRRWSRIRAECFPEADFGEVTRYAESLTFDATIAECAAPEAAAADAEPQQRSRPASATAPTPVRWWPAELGNPNDWSRSRF